THVADGVAATETAAQSACFDRWLVPAGRRLPREHAGGYPVFVGVGDAAGGDSWSRSSTTRRRIACTTPAMPPGALTMTRSRSSPVPVGTIQPLEKWMSSGNANT